MIFFCLVCACCVAIDSSTCMNFNCKENLSSVTIRVYNSSNNENYIFILFIKIIISRFHASNLRYFDVFFRKQLEDIVNHYFVSFLVFEYLKKVNKSFSFK